MKNRFHIVAGAIRRCIHMGEERYCRHTSFASIGRYAGHDVPVLCHLDSLTLQVHSVHASASPATPIDLACLEMCYWSRPAEYPLGHSVGIVTGGRRS